uniref:hypothetical protein n=1 Tax=Cupriavidus yeoncheonensis TaxID=1462994 RepID=UPI003F49363A
MSPTIDPTFEMIRSGHQAALHALILLEEARQAMLKLQVSALEDDIKGGQRMLTAIATAPDWNTLHGLPVKMLAEQVERNAEFARAAGKLSVEASSNFFEHLRTGAEQWAECQRNALRAGGGIPPLSESLKGMFDNVSEVIRWPGIKPAAELVIENPGS